MDLTKVVLPTFILERRSLLEMYADFFAHPDLFISIPDFDSPKDRFVQVVRWYLSAFHAGRKSSVAKKPYNPILGEIFRCFWHIPNIQEDDDSPKKVEDGPVPWATRDHLTFIAEQVSHHPPISAFYAEHVNKGISCTAHIWTKSKFLGLSIGVQNIGQAVINVLKHNEEYILTFPNGYGRSILRVPWIELGGSVTVSCPQTGYHANIEFHTRPIYGGKKHRITAELFGPNEKKSFLTVTGEWNGVMEAKWTSGETEIFVDTRTIPIIKKRVKPLVEQEEYESRKLWKDVTTALRLRNVEAATEAKFLLEQKQREEAKERLENKRKWETRAFHEIGENWMYDKSLQVRLQ
ncbi:Oxysterol-binding protein-related protein 9, partial [Stegodyphus mimosarum]